MSQYIGRTGLAYARAWHHVDMARDSRSLGQLASSIAITLMGKHKPIYHGSVDCGDYVVVSNCHYLNVTGNKMDQKMYYRHSGRPGQLKEFTMKEMLRNKGGGEILRKAVSGMLPKNRLRKFRLERLKTFEDSQNKYAGNLIAFHDEQPEVRKLQQELKKD